MKKRICIDCGESIPADVNSNVCDRCYDLELSLEASGFVVAHAPVSA